MGKGKANTIVSGLSWSFGERILAQGVTFIVSIVLARILAPEEYGAISLVLVFINLANVFVTNGFGEALIQKKDADERDFSTIFWCTFVFSWVLYAVLFFSAPIIGEFYKNTELVVVLRVLSLKIPLASINTIQHAYVSKRMEFKKFFFSTLGGTIASGVVGIVMAFLGFGVWALVAQYLVNSTIDTLVLFSTVRWRPHFEFNSSSATKLMQYAWKATGAAFINELYTQVRALIIGKVYSSADLAYYNRGNQFPQLFITNIVNSINKVFFPVMSTLQDDIEELKSLAKKSLKVSALVIFPLMTGLIGVAKPLVILLLTEKWLPCVPFLQILCLYYMVQPMQSINWQLMKALGRSDLCLKLEIVKKVIGFALIFATMFISVKALAWSTALFALISMIINMLPNKKLVGYSIKEQFKDIAPYLLLSSIMGIIVWGVSFIPGLHVAIVLIMQLATGLLVYCFGCVLFRLDAFEFIIHYVKNILRK